MATTKHKEYHAKSTATTQNTNKWWVEKNNTIEKEWGTLKKNKKKTKKKKKKIFFFFLKQKTAYENGTGDWSSDVCSSDLYANCLPDYKGVKIKDNINLYICTIHIAVLWVHIEVLNGGTKFGIWRFRNIAQKSCGRRGNVFRLQTTDRKSVV